MKPPIALSSSLLSAGGVLLLALAAGCGGAAGDAGPVAPVPLSADLPQKLSDLGLFAEVATLTPAQGVRAYDVRFPLWSDHAAKDRHVYLPDGGKIEVDDDGRFHFPDGTMFAKTFSYGEGEARHTIETRVMRKKAGRWSYQTYLWNEAQDDATLTDGKDVVVDVTVPGTRDTKYVVPGRVTCMQCHVGSPVSGFHPWQVGDEVLARLHAEGRLDTEPEAIPHRSVEGDSREEVAALGYMAANCAHCHNPKSTAFEGDELDLRHHLAKQNLMDREAARLKRADVTRLVVPRDHEKSVVWRLFTRGLDGRSTNTQRMPPVGNVTIDAHGEEVIRSWIASLDPEER